jgi:predicted transcriptional regulator
MSADDTTDEGDEGAEASGGTGRDAPAGDADERRDATGGEGGGIGGPDAERSRTEELTDRLSEETDKAVEEFDQRLVDLLSWMLDTETRARIYVELRQAPHSTSDEIADGTGLYPSTVREALAELHDEDVVERRKRESEGAGNNPYEYAAIAPSDLVGTVAERVQSELNTVFNLDQHVRGGETEPDVEDEPVTITVQDEGATEDASDGGTSDGETNDDDAMESESASTEEDLEADDAHGASDDADD